MEVAHLLTPRRQELRELRLLQKEEHRNQNQLSRKHELQLEQMHKRFEQEINVSARNEGPDTASCLHFALSRSRRGEG